MLLHKTNELALDIQEKSEKLNAVVYAVKDVGTTIQDLNNSVKKVTTSISSTMVRNQDKISQVVQWGSAIKELKDKWTEKKVKKQDQEFVVDKETSNVSRRPRRAKMYDQ
jgi:uncharacterized protein YoxC